MKRIFILITVFWLAICFTRASVEEEKKDKPPKDMYFTGEPGPVPEKMKKGFDSISAEDAENYLKFLSSDLLEGRDTGTNTYDIAAQFAAVLLRMWEIKPAGDFPPRKRQRIFETQKKQDKEKKSERTYFQEMTMKEFLESERSITLYHRIGASNKTRTFYPDKDYINTTNRPGSFEEISAPIVFVGFGVSENSIKFDEYKGMDVKGKIVLMFSGFPREDKEDSPFNKGKLKEKYYPTVQQMRKQGFDSPKMKLAEEKGAVAVLEVTPSLKGRSISAITQQYRQINDEEPIIPGKSRSLSLNNSTPYWPWDRVPDFYISREMAELILGLPPKGKTGEQLEELAKKIEENFKPQSRELPGVFITIKNTFKTELVPSRNVLGFIEGSDAKLKDEVVIIGAHLDHLGKRGDYIYNGAADNGSGSAALLELAQAFALNPVKPKRSILFALWTGEEYGMLGSRYYTDYPYFPLEKTAAYLNMDMIGWEWEDKDLLTRLLKREGYEIPGKILEKIDPAKFLMPSLAEESEEMYETIKNCGEYMGFTLLLRKSGGMIGGSDHIPFARKNITWAHFSGGTKKHYHQPSDSIDKINFDMIRDVARLMYTIAFTYADK
jgi:hypothetical protein